MGKVRDFIIALREYPEVVRELEGIRREIEVEAYFAERDAERLNRVAEDWVRCHIIV